MPKETKSNLKKKTKKELQKYARNEYGIHLSTSNKKDEMIDNFMKKLAKSSRASGSSSGSQLKKLQSNMFYVAAILGILIIISLGYNVKMSQQVSDMHQVFQDARNQAQGQQPTQQQGNNQGNDQGQGQGQQKETATVSTDGDPVLGDEDAPVTIIAFEDYQCPFCKKFYDNAYQQIKEDYIDTGKVKYVYRDLPLKNLHPKAELAAEAAECAGDQGAYWDYHDKLFENQKQISEDSLKQWAGDLGLDTNQFNQCLDSGKFSEEVQQDKSDGQSAGASGTPTFFIGQTTDDGTIEGKKLVGAHPYNTFKEVIDSELNK